MFKTTPLPAATCPQCSHEIDAGSTLTGERAPRSGDFSLCVYCGCGLRFDQYSWSFVRRASTTELSDLARDQPDSYRVFMRMQRLIRQRRGRKGKGKA